MKTPATALTSTSYRIWLGAIQARAVMLEDGWKCSGIGCDHTGYYFRYWR